MKTLTFDLSLDVISSLICCVVIGTFGITSTKDLQEGITSSSTNWSNQVKINLGWSISIFSGFGVWLGVSAKIVTVGFGCAFMMNLLTVVVTCLLMAEEWQFVSLKILL